MLIRQDHYVPILKWRQGEYQALHRLDDEDKNCIIPLIVIPPIEYDFEAQCQKKTVQEHIETFPNRFNTKWSRRKALIDIHDSLDGLYMDDGLSVIKFIFEAIKQNKSTAIPVFTFNKSKNYINDLISIIKSDNNGVAFRITLPELTDQDLNRNLKIFTQALNIQTLNIDLILDIGKPEAFEPYSSFSKALVNAIKKIENLNLYRSFALIATSLNLSIIKKPGSEVPRHEWHLYKQITKDLTGFRIPSYGDYSIETPEFTEMDMRQIKPAGKIVYTSDDVWMVAKGNAFRGNEAQMFDHCDSIMKSTHWCGAEYSHGDKRINDTFLKTEGHGNLSTWKQVGVSHHLVKVVEQLAKFHEA